MNRLSKTILLTALVVLIGAGLFYFPTTAGREDVSLLQWKNVRFMNKKRNKVARVPKNQTQVPPSNVITPNDGSNVVIPPQTVVPPQTSINVPGTTNNVTNEPILVPEQDNQMPPQDITQNYPTEPNVVDNTPQEVNPPVTSVPQPIINEDGTAQTPAPVEKQAPAQQPAESNTANTGTNHPFGAGGRGADLPQKYATAYISSLDQEIFRLVNEARRQNGLNELQWDGTLYEMSKYKSTSMLQLEYFAHENPNYGNEGPSAIAKDFGYGYRGLGENILYVQGSQLNNITAKYLFDMWMNSPGHRANILHADFTKIGVSVVYCDSYKSSVILYATQQFAN